MTTEIESSIEPVYSPVNLTTEEMGKWADSKLTYVEREGQRVDLCPPPRSGKCYTNAGRSALKGGGVHLPEDFSD